MEAAQKNGAYDYERCRAVWKRVAPEQEPYPVEKKEEASAELSLPGAAADPCCMGTEAELSVEVLQGFVRVELGDAQVCAFLASHLPRREIVRFLRAMAEEKKRRARSLTSAIYLITGKTYCPRVYAEQPEPLDLCALLRKLYHAEACGGFNYARAAEETLDPCLAKLFAAMSEEEYRRAEELMKLLGKYLTP